MLREIADIVALTFARPFVWLMTVLPESLARQISRGCIFILIRAIPRSRAVGRRNLALIFPEKSEAERERILHESFETLSENLLGYCWGPLLTPVRANEICNYQEFQSTFARLRKEYPNTGVLLITLHFGRFEYFLHVHAMLCKPVAVLARGFGLPRLDAWWNKRRELKGNKVFWRKGGYKVIVDTLRQGTDVCFLFDQNVKKNHAMFPTFFGIPAATTKAVALASIRAGAPVVVGAFARVGEGKYRPVIKDFPPLVSPKEKREEAMLEYTEQLHRVCEEIIRNYPEQWFWIHRRFKTRPDGEAENIYAGI